MSPGHKLFLHVWRILFWIYKFSFILFIFVLKSLLSFMIVFNEKILISFVFMTFIWSLLIDFISSNDDHLFYWIFSSSIDIIFSMSEWELHSRADSVISHFTASMMKKLSKRTASKQKAEQPAKNNQSSVQMLISSKMSKKLM